MEPERPITPSTLSVKDLPWQVLWDKEKCALCGKCTAICPVNAIELGVFRKRLLEPPTPRHIKVITVSDKKQTRPTDASVVPCAPWFAPMTA